MNRLRGWAALVALAAPLVATAQHIYTCKDKGGHTLTSDRPIPECADLPMTELNRSGVVVREIPAPLTPAQQAAADLEAKKQKEAEEEKREQHRRDVALLNTYPDEASIESARTRNLADFLDALRQANDNLASLMKDHAALMAEQAGYKGKPIPLNLSRRIDQNNTEINGAQRTIEDRKRDIARINQRFDADLARFKELEAANGVTPASASAH